MLQLTGLFLMYTRRDGCSVAPDLSIFTACAGLLPLIYAQYMLDSIVAIKVTLQ